LPHNHSTVVALSPTAASDDDNSHFKAAFAAAINIATATAIAAAITIAFTAAIAASSPSQPLSPSSSLPPLPPPPLLQPPPMPTPPHPHPCLCCHYCCSLHQRHCASDAPVDGWLLCPLLPLACCVVRCPNLSAPPVVRSPMLLSQGRHLLSLTITICCPVAILPSINPLCRSC